MAVDGTNPARAHALEVQRLMASFRERGILPPANFKGAKDGLTPAQRSAANLGVGDNLQAAVSDIHTADLPRESSWVDQLSTDIVNGDGSIDPELAFADIQIYGVGETLQDPEGVAEKVSSLIHTQSSLALLAHRFDSTLTE